MRLIFNPVLIVSLINSKGIFLGPEMQDITSENLLVQVLLLMDSRIELMRDVAIWKYHFQLPVEDKLRESKILSDIREKSIEKGCDENDVSLIGRFFEDQIKVARLVQMDWINSFSKIDTSTMNHLDEYTRPRIHRITVQILDYIHRQILGPEKKQGLKEFDQISERYLNCSNQNHRSMLLQNLREIF